MTWRYGRRREGRVFTGAIFLIVGIFLLLGNLNVLNLRPVLSHWWPVILMIIGVKQLLLWRGSAAWVGGLFWIGTGALFLASTLGYIHVSIASIVWPLMLIGFGVMLALGPSGCGRITHNCDEAVEGSIRDGSEM